MKWTNILAAVVVVLALISSGIIPAEADSSPPTPTTSSEVIQRLSLEQLTIDAEVVLVGTVSDTRSYWNAEHTLIFTDATVSVENIVKGDQALQQVMVTVVGGQVDDLTLTVPEAPSFQVTERALLFLKQGAGKSYSVLGWQQGKYVIDRDKINADTSLSQFIVQIQQVMTSHGIPLPPPRESLMQITENLTQPRIPFVTPQADQPQQGVAASGGWQTIMTENFEGSFPGTGWQLYGNPTWGKDDYKPFNGSYSAWCARGGSSGQDPQSSNYPNNMNAWIVYGPFDLSGASGAQLNFYLWLDSEENYDYFKWGTSINGVNFSVQQISGNFNGWLYGSVDLSSYCGQPSVWIGFIFQSNSSVTYKGAFLDDVQLSKYVGPAPTISSVVPSSASAGTNTQVTISGTNFGATQGLSNVTFYYQNGQPRIEATVVSWSDTSIVATVPVDNNGYPRSASSGPVIVTTGLDSNGYQFEVPFGYMGAKWPGGSPAVHYRINPNTADVVGEELAVQAAAQTWSNVSGAAFHFVYDGTTTATAPAFNGINEIMWGNIDDTNTIAATSWVTYLWWDVSGHLQEFDIEFNDYYTWSTNGAPNTYDIQSIATHELGHALGLRDLYGDVGTPNDMEKTMYGFSALGETKKRSLEPGDEAGVLWIYPDTVPPTVTINQAAGQADPTNTSPINFTVVFSEPVTDFATGDVTLSGTAGGTKTGTVTGSGTTYTVAVSGMTSDGTVIATIAAGVAHDAAGNGNIASTSTDNQVTYDTTSPAVTINQAAGQVDPTKTSPVNFTVVFSESVSDFATGDVTLSGTAGATTATVTGSGTTYNAAVSGMTSDGTVIATIAAGVAHDAAGNSNTASTSTDNTITYDTTAPTVTINQAAGQADPTNASPINFTVVFSKPVTDFATGDVTLSGTAGGTKTGTVTGSGTTYTVAVSGMTSNGTVIATIAAGKAHDAAGNSNTASTSTDNTVTYDTTAPTVTLTSIAPNPTKTSPIPVTATFSETVTGFVVDDITVGNGTAGSFAAVSSTVYTFNVTPADQGQVTVDIAAGVAQDAAGNGNTAATQLTRTYDSVAPTVALTSSAPDPTKTSPIPVTATFSETVTGFVVGDITIGNGTPGNFVAVSGKVYTFNVTPAGQGQVTVDITDGVAQDAAGNGNTAATQLTRTYDSVAPTVTINQAAGQADPTNTSPINFTAVFSEPVTDFVTGDVTLSGTAGATTATVTGSGTTYTVAVSGMTSDGTVIASIAAGKAHDASGNPNTASTSTDNTVTYDTTAPTVTLTSTAPNPTKTSPIPVAATFSEAVTGFVVDDITVGNGTAGNFVTVSGTVYTFNVTPTGQGQVTVDIAAGVAQDAAGNGNTAATQLTRTYDNVAPTVTLTSTAPDPTKTSPIPVTATFSEAVTGFMVGDITVGNGTAGNFVTVSSTVYTFNVTPAGQGQVTVDIAAGVAQDAAGNGNTAATQLTRTYDTVAPTVTINQAAGQADPTNTSPINFTAVFSEPVSDFITGDVTLSGTAGATTATVTGSGTTYTVAVSGMTSDGTVIATIAAGKAHDAAGNSNTASTSTDNTVTYDTTAPTVTINQASGQADPTNTSPINFAVVFSEPVTDFVTGDVTLNGTAGPTTATITGSGTTYTVAVSGMTSDGTVIASIAAGKAHDAAGNSNTTSTSTDNTVTYDTTAPTMTSAQTKTTTTIAVTFSEDVNGTTVNKANFAVSGNTVIAAGRTANGVVTLTLGTTIATDATPNVTYTRGTLADLAGNLVATTTVTASDGVAPTLTSVDIASSNAKPTLAKAGDTVTLTIIASESLQTLTATIDSHAATVSGSGTSWSATYITTSEDTEWLVEFSIAFSDLPGNVGTPVTYTTDGSFVSTLEDVAPITGFTYEVNHNVLPGVTITLLENGIEIATTLSNSGGNYTIVAPEIGTYSVIASKTGFRDETQPMNITTLGQEYPLNFKGKSGIIPKAPNIWYLLDCAALWKYPPAADPDLGLNIWRLLDVAAAWKYPLS